MKIEEFSRLPKNILITGVPGCGKTTLFKQLVAELGGFHPAGFYTDEIRKGGVRKGFRLCGLDGRTSLLAHVDLKSKYKVGKYGVDVAGFERFLESIDFSQPSTSLIGIDEIGKMECFSARFNTCVKEIFNSDKTVIATIALKGKGLIAEIKSRPDVRLYELTRENRDTVFGQIIKLLR